MKKVKRLINGHFIQLRKKDSSRNPREKKEN